MKANHIELHWVAGNFTITMQGGLFGFATGTGRLKLDTAKQYAASLAAENKLTYFYVRVGGHDAKRFAVADYVTRN